MKRERLEILIKQLYIESDRSDSAILDISSRLSVSVLFVKALVKNVDNSILSSATYDNPDHNSSNCTDSTIDTLDLESEIAEPEEAKFLDERQKLFCHYYIENFNVKVSAIKAGYPQDPSFNRRINYLMSHKHIIAYIKYLSSKIMASVSLSAEMIIARHMKIAFSDISDYIEWGTETVSQDVYGNDGEVLDSVDVQRDFVRLKDLSGVDTSLVKKVRKTRDGIDLELEDKSKSLDVLTNLLLLTKAQADKAEIEREKANMNVGDTPDALANKVKGLSDTELEVFMNELKRR